MRGMGRSSILWASALVAVSGGCRDAGAVPLRAANRDTVSFEVGGDAPVLADVLRSSSAARADVVEIEIPPSGELTDGPVQRWREVPLAPGQTLSQLCAAELGSAARWREVAALNGWTEAEVSRLPSGVAVKLPIE